ncbi:MAG: ATP-binding protein [Candidatus Hydrothermae bacterium]|nr:ATP-binding protein [Candidatus Hydrothermae bacterium]
MRLRERFLIWGALWSTVVSIGVAGVLIAVYGLPPETVSRGWWLFALYLLVLLGPLWWALQHWIFRPLDRMNRANRAIREGRWEEAMVPAHQIPENEIGALIRSRNDALEHLRRDREVLEEARAFQEAILESIPDPLCVLHAERYEILLANPAFHRVYGEPYPEGKPCYRVMHGLDHPCHLEGIACPLRAYRERREAPVHGVYTRQHRHEDEHTGRVMEVRLWPMDTPRKRPWVVHVSRDVTEERQRQARALAQERLAAMGMLAAGIAHDFNNLLTPIVGYTELLLRERDLDPDAQSQALQVILEQAREAGRLVRQMLEFSRSSSSRERRALPLVPFLKEWVKLLRHSFPERIRIALHLPPSGCVIQADPTQIREALMNLAVNARDAMPEGGKLEIRLERFPHPPAGVEAPADQPYVRLRIRDTGTGIPEEVVYNILCKVQEGMQGWA